MLRCGWTETALCYKKAARYRRFPIVWFCSHTISKIGKLIQTECRLITSRDREEGDGVNCFTEFKVSFGGDESVLKLDRVAACTILQMYYMPLNCTL